jgi:hypothetical protein
MSAVDVAISALVASLVVLLVYTTFSPSDHHDPLLINHHYYCYCYYPCHSCPSPTPLHITPHLPFILAGMSGPPAPVKAILKQFSSGREEDKMSG